MTRLVFSPSRRYRPRRSYVRPYVLVHERRVQEREAAERMRREQRYRAVPAAFAVLGAAG
ncbi:hypothetical protein GCM10022205_15100 [Spinactinospora alkalitolerans]